MILLSWMSSESFPQEVLLIKTTDTSGGIVSITVETMAEHKDLESGMDSPAQSNLSSDQLYTVVTHKETPPPS